MKNFKIHFLNTIWSDAILLESNNHFGFIDTGSTFYFPMIKDHLDKLNIKNLEFIILTHFHSDHYGNIKNIIEHYNVDKIYLKRYYGLDGNTSGGFASNDEYISNEFKNYNSIIDACHNNNTSIIFLDDLKTNTYYIDFQTIILEVYDCENRLYNLYTDSCSQFYNKKIFNENYNSCGIYININNHNIFLGGDVTCSNIESEELKKLSIKMVNNIYQTHNINQIDIYKSCHHGGSGTNTDELCNLIKAKYAIITNTARWLDNYNTFNNLKNGNENVKILTTDHQKYIFDLSTEEIKYKNIKEESLFIILNKN